MSVADISEDRSVDPWRAAVPSARRRMTLAEQSTLGGMLLSSDAVADVIEASAAPTSTCRSTS